ncbi:MAG TPA: hypothetical protein VFI73_08800 [Candidatus Nitrosopolaris sp.]|nr:hypothetical protein [Candidatus Nitrosopolaris sp.]
MKEIAKSVGETLRAAKETARQIPKGALETCKTVTTGAAKAREATKSTTVVI